MLLYTYEITVEIIYMEELIMHRWNDKYLEKMYNRVKAWALKDYTGEKNYNFTEEELAHPNLSSKNFNTKSPRIWRMITLAFILGQMSGIRRADEGKTPIMLSGLESSETKENNK